MKVLGLDLDNSPHIAKDKSLRYAKNITIDKTGQSYFNEYGFTQNAQVNSDLEHLGLNNANIQLIGTIPTNVGVVLFIVYTNTDVYNKSGILYYNNELKRISRCYLETSEANYLNFDENRPIHGDYIYNYKNELIVVFTEGGSDDANETRIFNIDNYLYKSDYTYELDEIVKKDGYITIRKEDINNIFLIPDIEYPTLDVIVEDGGNLKTGAYQIAIKYKFIDGTYTNYSTLTPSTIVCSNYEEEYGLGIELNKHLKVKITGGSNFNYYKLAIVYIDDTGQLVYETNDISIDKKEYIINDLSEFNAISLEDIFIKNISYIKDSTLVNFNNRLIRAGVKTVNYDSELEESLKNIANSNVEVLVTYDDVNKYINTTNRYFKEGEVYSLYIGFHDYKGDLVNIYPINAKDKTIEGIEPFKITDNNYAYKIKYRDYDGDRKIPILDIKLNTNDIPKNIKSVSYYFVEHNINNSKIISQAIGIYDTKVNEFGNSQTYSGQFADSTKHRLYPFELLYNKINKLQVKLQPLYKTNDLIPITSETEGIDKKIYDNIKVVKGDTNVEEGLKYVDANVETLTLLDFNNTGIESEIFELKYIPNDNTSIGNIAGDSFYRISNVPSDTLNDLINKCYIVDIVNKNESLYSGIDNQKLQIASPIINIENAKDYTSLIGDTYISYLTLRLTTPASDYIYGDSKDKDKDSNAHVYRWIVTLPIESKYNILARYGINQIDKPYKYHNKKPADMLDALRLSYKVDNFINSSVGKGYSTVFNENGIEPFIYFNSIVGVKNHPYRLIRSLAQDSEALSLNWRIYKSDDYKDMPFNKGDIISLKTDNQYLYIQQKYALHLLQQRDTLSNDENNNSYLGTSDIFNMEPKEIMFSPTGYIGCENYFDTHINVTGYYVVDIVNKNIYNVASGKVNKISDLNVKSYFDKYLIDTDINIYKNIGRYFVYDEDTNILYLTQNNRLNSNYGFTISYSPIHKCWISFHSYKPIAAVYTKHGIIRFTSDMRIYLVDKSKTGRFITENWEDSIIQFISNTEPLYNKLVNHIAWLDRVSKLTNDEFKQVDFYKTIDKIMIHNDDQCSGYKDVKFNDKWYDGSKGVNKINIWRFNDITDIAKNNTFMLDYINVDNTKLKQNVNWYDINRFISQYIYITMIYDNSKNMRWELIEVNPDYSLDNRNTQENVANSNK